MLSFRWFIYCSLLGGVAALVGWALGRLANMAGWVDLEEPLVVRTGETFVAELGPLGSSGCF